jgi:hypothetical protein
MSAWLDKWGPLAGVLAGLLVGRGALLRQHPPGDSATGPQVIEWYSLHGKSDGLAVLAAMVGLVLLVAFAAVMTGHAHGSDRWLVNGALAGAAIAAAGFGSLLSFDLVLVTDVKDLTPASAQTLNLLQNDFFVPAVIGFALFGVLGGLAVVSGRIIAKWMGWLLLAVGVLVLIPPISAFCITAIMLWVVVTAIWMTRQGPPAREHEPVLAGRQAST